jgi:DNA adenine methylase
MIDATVRRPALRYHGGKWLLAPWIISHFPKHHIYVEPFGGGASILLRKQRSYAEIYNDLDGEVVNLFRMLRDHGDEVKRLVSLTPFSRSEFVDAYEPTDDDLEQARRTLVKSFMGFGSAAVTQHTATLPGAGFKADVNKYPTGFRCNSNRSGTTPAHDWKNWPERMDGLIERLQRNGYRKSTGHRSNSPTGFAEYAPLRRPAVCPFDPRIKEASNAAIVPI